MFTFGRGKRRWTWIAGVGLACAVAALLVFRHLNTPESPTVPLPKSFDNSSISLRETAIIATLDTPIPEGKSAVWCASFQLAWDRLKNDVAKGPVEVQNAEVVAARLNRAEFPKTGLDPNTFYAAAGLAKDEIIERIKAEMSERFPGTATPELDTTPDGAVAYGYLKAGVNYRHPFFDNDEPFTFTDSAGNSMRVKSFGVRKKDDYAYHRLREQVAILYCPQDSVWQEREIPELVLDPCKHSSPHQLVLARVARKGTLAATLDDVERKIKEQPTTDFTSRFHVRDTLLVPDMHWRVQHHFKELEGEDKRLLNPPLRGLHLATALQTIDFRMDRGGAEVASEAKVFVKPGASYFEFNRPFLVYMKKRGGDQPFFVMWVESAELMQPW
jgi:hypothetical protein